MLSRSLLAAFTLLLAGSATNCAATAADRTDTITAGSTFMTGSNTTRTLATGITYQRYEIDPRATAHVVRIDTKSGAWGIRPYLSETTEAVSTAAKKLNALVAVNGGFFNLSDGESTSYVCINDKQLCEPKHNMALVNNKGLQPFLTKIFNRSELRFLSNKSGRSKITIQPHADAVPRDWKLIHSIQAGPQLLPVFTGRDEAFIRRPPGATKDVDSIGCAMRAARTAFGITDDGTAVIVCVQGKRNKEFSEGISLPELAEFMKGIGCVQALNFDGGTSSTMVFANQAAANFADSSGSCEPQDKKGSAVAGSENLLTVVSSQPERHVKSIIYVTPGK
ncbi:MAG: phosphodiester glycosidase family protein [Candidatus Melainabacteria bacterium]|nr:phosphodiester glycosidase family protein [Candidatus Melainabacteria bacterium]